MYLIPAVVFAYIGPGLGAGAIAAALGLIGSFVLAIFAVLFYPIKRLIQKFKKNSSEISSQASGNTEIPIADDNND